MVAFSIKGDYFDCQLYAGTLFLWTYSGTLKAYNFNKMLGTLIDRGEIREDNLREFQVGGTQRTASRFPTDSEVYGGQYYLTSREGLFQSNLSELDQGFRKVWDCPLLSVSAQRKKGLTMAGGTEGTFIYSEVDAIRERYRMNEKKFVQASRNHANYSAFCSQGLYATSVLEKSYYLKLSIFYNNSVLTPVDEIFPNQHVELSWSYRDRVYAYIDEKIFIKKIVKEGSDNVKFVPDKEYWFYPQKGKVLSGTSTEYADIIELEHALVIFPTQRTENTHAETIWEPVTRWRTFPKSYGYNNIVMAILEDELRIYVVDKPEGIARPRKYPRSIAIRRKEL